DPSFRLNEGGSDAETNAWAKCADDLGKHDKEMAIGWKDQIDNLLVFAGLFSAVVTAFNVELYQQLSPDNTAEVTAQAMVHISAQLSSLRIENNTIDFSVPAYSPSETPHAPGPSIWVNAF
ncbi:hypothetical protein CERSUDRAFT_50825, partial [Gelatoporia subvermispora B]